MQVDVVIDYYRKQKTWPLVRAGLLANIDAIRSVIIVNDEPWTDDNMLESNEETRALLLVRLLDHKHEGFGAHKSIRQGMEAADTEYVLHIDGDVVLAPGSIEANLEYAEPELIVYGTTHDVPHDVTVDMYPDLPIEREDWRLKGGHPKAFPDFRDLHWIMRKKDYFAVGGHDLEYKDYGLVDYDLGCRFMLRFGMEAYMIGPGEAYHIGGKDRPEDKIGKETSVDNMARFRRVCDDFIRAQHGY